MRRITRGHESQVMRGDVMLDVKAGVHLRAEIPGHHVLPVRVDLFLNAAGLPPPFPRHRRVFSQSFCPHLVVKAPSHRQQVARLHAPKLDELRNKRLLGKHPTRPVLPSPQFHSCCLAQDPFGPCRHCGPMASSSERRNQSMILVSGGGVTETCHSTSSPATAPSQPTDHAKNCMYLHVMHTSVHPCHPGHPGRPNEEKLQVCGGFELQGA